MLLLNSKNTQVGVGCFNSLVEMQVGDRSHGGPSPEGVWGRRVLFTRREGRWLKEMEASSGCNGYENSC